MTTDEIRALAEAECAMHLPSEWYDDAHNEHTTGEETARCCRAVRWIEELIAKVERRARAEAFEEAAKYHGTKFGNESTTLWLRARAAEARSGEDR